MTTRLAFVLLCIPFLVPCVLAANSVSTPIIRNAMDVHTRVFAQLPETDGQPAKIICIIPHENDLYVCTLKIIYRVRPNGSTSVFLNVETAFSQGGGRNLNYGNVFHGGVRSIAFHPNFNRNRRIYVSAMEDRPNNPRAFKYISNVRNAIGADSVLVEFRVNRRNRPVISSYRLVFRVGMPVFDHPIKQIAFKGRFLYIAHGDGSEQSAVVGGGQRNDALGKILRINPRKTRSGDPYSIPSKNPFVNDPNMKSEVWALGFRNPHTICFSSTGRLFVADAGRDNVEEVNIVKKGKNYGWSAREGTFVHLPVGTLITGIADLPANDSRYGYEYPVAQVGHEGFIGQVGPKGQSIAGGCPVENGSPMNGNYFYSDFPESGNLYFSTLSQMLSARTRGNPRFLRQARTKQARIFYDHDNDPSTPPQEYDSLGDAMRSEPGKRSQQRVDVRFGRGKNGELYWSSKISGRVYLFTSSVPGGPGGLTVRR